MGTERIEQSMANRLIPYPPSQEYDGQDFESLASVA